MTSRCETVNVKRTLYIDRISLVYEIDKNDETMKLNRPAFEGLAENYMYSKISLNCQCDQGELILRIDGRKAFSLFNEETGNDSLSILIITY